MRIFDQIFNNLILPNENKLMRISNHWVHMKIKAKFRKHCDSIKLLKLLRFSSDKHALDLQTRHIWDRSWITATLKRKRV